MPAVKSFCIPEEICLFFSVDCVLREQAHYEGMLEDLLLLGSTGSAGGLLFDLGVVIVAAAGAALLFRQMGWPLIFGYLLAGLLVGPNLLPVSALHDVESIREISELGVVFLLFFIGMEFDLGKLRQLLGPAFVALILQTGAMLYLSKLVGAMLGWSSTSALFFGSLLAISSSMVTIRVLREQGRMKHPHAQLAVGILILEDVLAVLLLVILTGVAVTQKFDWGSAWLVTFLMGVFVVVVFLMGRPLAKRAIDALEVWDDREQITLFSMGLLMGVSLLALGLEFSNALGAFLAGAILSQTRLLHRFEEATRSLHDLFTAVFFVSVGMLIEPDVIVRNWGWVLGIALAVIILKTLTCWLGLFLAGQPSRSSFRGALSKAQIGEFSFIIAELGRSLEVTDARLTGIAFGVAFVTILATPFMTRHSERHFERLLQWTPSVLQRYGNFYRQFFESVTTTLGRNVLLRLLKRPLLQMSLYFFLLCGIILGTSLLAERLGAESAGFPSYTGAALWLGAALVCAPFLIAILRNANAVVYMLTEALFEGRHSRPIMQGKMRTVFNGLIFGLLMTFFGGLLLVAASSYLPKGSALLLFVALLVCTGGLFWRQLIRLNSQFEFLFMESFAEDARSLEHSRRAEVLEEISRKYPWEVEVCDYTIEDKSPVVGRRIIDLRLREKTGATIIALGRAGRQVFDPSPETPLFPGDHLILLGGQAETSRACLCLDTLQADADAPPMATSFETRSVLIEAGAHLDGNTLAGANIRRNFGVTIIGVQRGAQRITTPPGDFMLRAGDALLTVGPPSLLDRFADGPCSVAD